MIEIARILHLLVLANAVESHRFCQLNIPNERFVRWCGQQRFWPVALIEHQLLIIGTVVQQKLPVLYGYLAHSEVGLYGIHLTPMFKDAEGHIEQVRLLRCPDEVLLIVPRR